MARRRSQPKANIMKEGGEGREGGRKKGNLLLLDKNKVLFAKDDGVEVGRVFGVHVPSRSYDHPT